MIFLRGIQVGFLCHDDDIPCQSSGPQATSAAIMGCVVDADRGAMNPLISTDSTGE